MPRALILLAAFLFSSGASTLRLDARLMAWSVGDDSSGQTPKATVRPASEALPALPAEDEESKDELQLLILANQSRQEAGAPALTLDAGLSKAAQAHALMMLDSRQLSHQFPGEPSLANRLASSTELHLEQEGENVALDYDATRGHEHLMLSAPHRANLLNPVYNVVGMAVVRSGDRLYIVQDFGHALPNYSTEEVKQRVMASVNQMRRDARLPALPRQDLPNADEAACSMTQADRLGTSPVQDLAQRYTVLTYTSLSPELLPSEAGQAIASRHLRSFSVGVCYGRTATYPTGAYWIVLTLD
jgi:uncharacterized protein YkwD